MAEHPASVKPSNELPAMGAAAAGTGAVLTAAIASSCCVGPALAPVFVSILGASGLAAVSGLRPYSPLLLLASAVMLAFSFHQLYRSMPCSVDVIPASLSAGMRVARIVVWIAAVLWIASAAYAVYGLLHA